jgi:tRNA nucleotidyltransferase (CCA-adding enzyme)
VGKDFPVFLHPDTREEYALARTERKSGSGYTGFDCFSSPDVTLEEDLQRRDLTINAMAEDSAGNIIDPYGGQQDIANKKLRHVSPAFSEDPLRVLRVARFIARYHHLGFTIAAETLKLMQVITDSGELASLPKERIWRELQRALLEPNPEQFFISLANCGALQQLLPELDQHIDATLAVFSRACQQTDNGLLRFACLLSKLDPENNKQLCENMRAPREYRELALLVNQYGALTDEANPDSEQQLLILEKVDAFRRPQRFENFLAACEILFHNHSRQQKLSAALQASKSVDTKSLAERFDGKHIAAEIRKHRINAIEALEQQ